MGRPERQRSPFVSGRARRHADNERGFFHGRSADSVGQLGPDDALVGRVQRPVAPALSVTRYVYAVALTPDGRRALAGVGDAVYLLAPDPKYKGPGRGSIHVFDLAKGSEQHQFTSNSVVIALAVAPGGGYVLSGNFAGELELWRLPR